MEAQGMNWVKVQSSVLTAVAYAPDELWAEFATGGEIYRYSNVPLSVYQDLLDAESKGRYFNACIRDNFPFEHVRRSSGASS
jgi:hypothetical protein